MSTPVETPEGQPESTPSADPQAPEPQGQEAGRTFTQDEVDRLIANRLARQKAQFGDYDELRKAAARLKEIEDSQKSEQQRLAEQVEEAAKARTAAEERAKTLETQLLRQKVAIAKGLTPAQAARLQGATEEEIEADADDLLAAFAPTTPQTPARTPVAQLQPGAIPPGNAVPPDMSEWMRQRTPRTN